MLKILATAVFTALGVAALCGFTGFTIETDNQDLSALPGILEARQRDELQAYQPTVH